MILSPKEGKIVQLLVTLNSLEAELIVLNK